MSKDKVKSLKKRLEYLRRRRLMGKYKGNKNTEKLMKKVDEEDETRNKRNR